MKSRLLLALTAPALLLAGLPANSASAQWTSQPSMQGSNQVNVMKGSQSWVSVSWTAPTDMENFRMVLAEWNTGVDITYVEGRTSAGLSNDADLSAGEIDTASFRLDVAENAPSSSFIQVVAEWEHEGETYQYFPGGLNVRAEKFNGDRFSVLTDSATVLSGEAGAADLDGNWVEIDVLGLAPKTDGVEMRLDGKPEVYYPQTEFTSLHHDDRLHAQESDVARIWFDPELVDPGTYDMKLVVTYLEGRKGDSSAKTKSESFPFELTVE